MEERGTHVRRGISRRDFLKLGGAGLAGAALSVACGSQAGGSSNYPSKPVEVIVAYEAGGGTDVGARILQPYLEEELGQSITVVNKPGGGGWIGWGEIAQSRPDGYTIGFLNTPNFISGYLNPELNIEHDLDSFSLIGNQVTDYGVIAINPEDERFSDIDELVDYANQNRLTASSTGVGSDDHFASLTLNDKFGTRFKAVHTEGAAANLTSVLGKNIDVLFANVGEVTPLHRDGRLKAIAVMSDRRERSEYLSDVPTLAEAGYPGIYSWSSRGMGGPAGLDPQVKEALVRAFRKATLNKEHKQKLAEQGLQVDYKAPNEYLAMLKRDRERAKKLGDNYIW